MEKHGTFFIDNGCGRFAADGGKTNKAAPNSRPGKHHRNSGRVRRSDQNFI